MGRVSDASGAVVVAAEVAARNERTDVIRLVRTDARGEFAIPLLPPGVYEVTVQAKGFRQAIRGGTQLNVNQTLHLDFILQVGELTQKTTVLASAPAIQADTSALGQVVDRSSIQELPLNERNFLNFALLAPGTQLPADGSQISIEGGSLSVNGAREQSNNYLLDGVDNNDSLINQFSVLPSVDAIQEFKVQTANSSAEFGRSGGGQINVVLRGGSNDWHGSLYEFFRNRNLDAKNVFNLPDCTASSVAGTCASIPRLDRNQFGGTLGGPLRRDRLFLFVSYEVLHLRQATTRGATVPSQADRQAALAAIPSAARNPAGVAAFNLLPPANVGSDLTASHDFVASPVIRDTSNLPLVKLDYRIGPQDTVSGHYALYDDQRFNPYDPLMPPTNLPGYGSNWSNRGQIVGVAWTHTWNPRLVHDVRFGFNRRRGDLLQQDSGINHSQQLGFPTVKSSPVDLGFPGVVIAGFDGIGESRALPQERRDDTFQLGAVVAWNPEAASGRHRFKFGTDVRRFHMDGFLDPVARGQWFFQGVFTGDPLRDLLLGLPVFALAGIGDTTTALRTTSLNFFAQDDLRVSRGFTLNLGLRYEYNSPVTDTHNRLSAPDLSANSAACSPKPNCQFIVAGTSGLPRATYGPDKTNFAPRVGFAWQPFASHPFTVRSAYGIFYDVGILNANLLPRFNPPFFQVELHVNNGTNTIQDILSQPTFPQPPIAVRIDPDYRDAYLQQWNLDLQWEVANSTVVAATYVGSKGTHLQLQRNSNQATPGTSASPFPQFGPINQIESTGSSTYDSLQLRTERRLFHDLAFLAGYNWSRSIDDASALFGTGGEPGFPQDSFNLARERGLSNFHAGQRLVADFLYSLPLGKDKPWLRESGVAQALFGNWGLSGILVAQSGRPFTVNRGIDQSKSGTANLGIFADRPNIVSDPFQPGPVPGNPDPACQLTISQGGRAADRVRTPESWFNPCAFVDPGVAFGNAGRNTLLGPGLASLDFSASKQISFGEGARQLQFRADFFNIFNHPNFDLPDRIFDSRTFAQLSSANANGTKPPRQIQIGLRFLF